MEIQTHDGLRLHLETHGQGAPILYLHGGPGGGCFDFVAFQDDRLGARFQLIAFDQRGVHRSDALDGRSCTLADLVADTEAVRQQLGHERVTLYGHGTGALIALRYAAAHPERIAALVLENPVIDLVAAARSLARAAGDLLQQRGDTAGAAAARAVAEATSGGPRETFVACWSQLDRLGEQRDALRFQAIDPISFYELQEECGLTPDQVDRSDRHTRALLADPAMYEPLDALLPTIQAPTLVARGRFDALCSAAAAARMQQAFPVCEVISFAAACHYPHMEEANRFAQLVGGWLAKTLG